MLGITVAVTVGEGLGLIDEVVPLVRLLCLRELVGLDIEVMAPVPVKFKGRVTTAGMGGEGKIIFVSINCTGPSDGSALTCTVVVPVTA